MSRPPLSAQHPGHGPPRARGKGFAAPFGRPPARPLPSVAGGPARSLRSLPECSAIAVGPGGLRRGSLGVFRVSSRSASSVRLVSPRSSGPPGLRCRFRRWGGCVLGPRSPSVPPFVFGVGGLRGVPRPLRRVRVRRPFRCPCRVAPGVPGPVRVLLGGVRPRAGAARAALGVGAPAGCPRPGARAAGPVVGVGFPAAAGGLLVGGPFRRRPSSGPAVVWAPCVVCGGPFAAASFAALVCPFCAGRPASAAAPAPPGPAAGAPAPDGPSCPPPCCPGCGRVAASWSAVPLCGRCRGVFAALPRPCRLAALRLAHARPAPPAAPPSPGRAQLALWG